MTNIKENNEVILRKIRETIENKFSKKFTIEEILEKCLKFSRAHLDDLFNEKTDFTEPISEKIKRIISNAQEYQLYDLNKSDDELLYGTPKN